MICTLKMFTYFTHLDNDDLDNIAGEYYHTNTQFDYLIENYHYLLLSSNELDLYLESSPSSFFPFLELSLHRSINLF